MFLAFFRRNFFGVPGVYQWTRNSSSKDKKGLHNVYLQESFTNCWNEKYTLKTFSWREML